MKAVVKIGGKQYIVAEKDTILVDKLADDAKELKLDVLMTFDAKGAKVGTPTLKGASVSAKVVEELVKGDKIKVMKFQAKKRVKKMTGHRQQYTKLEITKIA